MERCNILAMAPDSLASYTVTITHPDSDPVNLTKDFGSDASAIEFCNTAAESGYRGHEYLGGGTWASVLLKDGRTYTAWNVYGIAHSSFEDNASSMLDR